VVGDQVAEFQRRVDAGGRHRCFQSRLESSRMSVAEGTEAIMLFPIAFGMESKGEACV
jgi:hypothetical protein